MNKRQCLNALGLLTLMPSAFADALPLSKPLLSKARVLVVGGGYGGLSVAKHLRTLSHHQLQVTLIEMQSHFISSPLSNLVLSGQAKLQDITLDFQSMAKRHGIAWIQDRAIKLDSQKKRLHLKSHDPLPFDKIVLSPGIGFDYEAIEGLAQAHQEGQCLQAWSNNQEVQQLKEQLQQLPNGSTMALCIPESPYKCPPAPYERACQIASYFKAHTPDSKVIVFDANDHVVSNAQPFQQFWSEHYAQQLQYMPSQKLIGVQNQGRILSFEVQDDATVDLANVLPPMRAADIARHAGVVNVNDKWCSVNFLDFQSDVVPDVHVLGDAIQAASLMPKSAHMAHAQGLVVARAILKELAGEMPDTLATLDNVCYSFLDDSQAIHIASKHHYDLNAQTYLLDEHSSDQSKFPTPAEGKQAWQWAHRIWHDMLS